MWRKATYYRSASVAALATLPVIVACALLGATDARAATCTISPSTCDPYVVTFQQEGSNIVATGTGEFDTTGLTNTSGNFGLIGRAQLSPSVGQLLFGSVSGVPGFDVTGPPASALRFSGIMGTTPTSVPISTDNGVPPTIVGINGGLPSGFPPFFSLSSNYVSGAVITNVATFVAASLSCVPGTEAACNGLGVQPDQVLTWTWGSAPDQSFTINTTLSIIPVPAALPLFATGLGALGLLGRRRKRRAQAVA